MGPSHGLYNVETPSHVSTPPTQPDPPTARQLSALAIPQLLDDDFPQLTATASLIPSTGANADPLFDYVTFRVPTSDTAPTAARRWPTAATSPVPDMAMRLPGRPFPRKLWAITREWAADWADYTAALRARGMSPVPSEWYESTGVRRRRSKRRPANDLTGKTLNKYHEQLLGVQPGFCAVTSDGESNCNISRSGSVRLSKLMDRMPYEPPIDWNTSLTACRQLCTECQTCRCARAVWRAPRVAEFVFCHSPPSASHLSHTHVPPQTLRRSKTSASASTPHLAARAMLSVCLDSCTCRYITLSLSADDCSWYATCNLRKLHLEYPGFYSTEVPRLAPKALDV